MIVIFGRAECPPVAASFPRDRRALFPITDAAYGRCVSLQKARSALKQKVYASCRSHIATCVLPRTGLSLGLPRERVGLQQGWHLRVSRGGVDPHSHDFRRTACAILCWLASHASSMVLAATGRASRRRARPSSLLVGCANSDPALASELVRTLVGVEVGRHVVDRHFVARATGQPSSRALRDHGCGCLDA